MADLLIEFVREECSRPARALLDSYLNAAFPEQKKFEFNRFEVTIDRASHTVLIEDVLDASDRGAQTVALADFRAALEPQTSAR